MNGEEIKTQAENILDGETIGTSLFYEILETVKTVLEEERNWRYLIKLISSAQTSSSDNWQTFRDLEDDFARPFKLNIGEDENVYDEKSFEESLAYKDSSGYYYIDHANDRYALTGIQSNAQTIYFWYIKFTPKITENTSPLFKERFHMLLAFRVAAYIQGAVDADDIYAKMSPENKTMATALEDAMATWNAELEAGTMNYSTGPQSERVTGENQIDIRS